MQQMWWIKLSINIVFLLLLLGATLYDIRYKRIPVNLLISMLILGGMVLLTGMADSALPGPAGIVFLKLFPGTVFILLSLSGNKKIGMADGMMIMAIGMFFDLEMYMVVLMLAFMLAALEALTLIVLRKAHRDTKLAFAPPLTAAVIIGEILHYIHI